jgi:mono/diheme cytochrome c family protein
MHTFPKLIAATIALAAPIATTQAADPRLLPAPILTTPLPLNAAGEGRRAYLKFNCYSCHGMAAAGAMGPKIIGKERGDVAEAMAKGLGGGMPSYRLIATELDATNLGAYLLSIGTRDEPVFNDWWVPVPPK